MRLHWPLVSLGLLFVTPAVIAAYMLIFIKDFSWSTVEHGNFIDPPQQLQLVGTAANKWNIVYVKPEFCNMTCQLQLQELSKLQTALGADSSRVNILATEAKQIKAPGIAPKNILILNPMGLYIMHYDADANYNGVLKDMRRLLKYSHAL